MTTALWSIERDIIWRLHQDANMVKKVGTKVYLEEAPPYPESSFPFIVLRRSGTEIVYKHGGNLGLEKADIDFDIYCVDIAESRSIGQRLRDLFSGFRGDIRSFYVMNCLIVSITGFAVGSSKGERDRVHGLSIETEFWYKLKGT